MQPVDAQFKFRTSLGVRPAIQSTTKLNNGAFRRQRNLCHVWYQASV